MESDDLFSSPTSRIMESDALFSNVPEDTKHRKQEKRQLHKLAKHTDNNNSNNTYNAAWRVSADSKGRFQRRSQVPAPS
ncbi:hypothetical protein AVEN_155747-1, partial [Araneus ventricosus]